MPPSFLLYTSELPFTFCWNKPSAQVLYVEEERDWNKAFQEYTISNWEIQILQLLPTVTNHLWANVQHEWNNIYLKTVFPDWQLVNASDKSNHQIIIFKSLNADFKWMMQMWISVMYHCMCAVGDTHQIEEAETQTWDFIHSMAGNTDWPRATAL